ncbi:hypothetical protein [Nonomuraea recticatena]|uniref:hypothetical protein n=1 Tax=Nonomuraea recticatena TaxID=46178 RepID=UPI0036206E0C
MNARSSGKGLAWTASARPSSVGGSAMRSCSRSMACRTASWPVGASGTGREPACLDSRRANSARISVEAASLSPRSVARCALTSSLARSGSRTTCSGKYGVPRPAPSASTDG